MQMPDDFFNISLNTGFRFQIIDIANQLIFLEGISFSKLAVAIVLLRMAFSN
jgi:hypothetical protein